MAEQVWRHSENVTDLQPQRVGALAVVGMHVRHDPRFVALVHRPIFARLYVGTQPKERTTLMSHVKISTAAAIALIHEIAGLAVGLGVLNGSTQGLVVTAAVSAVNVGGLIANAIHHVADSNVSAKDVAAGAISAARGEIATVDFNGLVKDAVDAKSFPDLEAQIEAKARQVLAQLLGQAASSVPVAAPPPAVAGAQPLPVVAEPPAPVA